MPARSARALVALTAVVCVALVWGVIASPIAAAENDRYALGDSVMLGAKSQLLKRGFAKVNAIESRQAYSGPATLRKLGSRLPRNVVVHLGTNGTFPLDVCKAIVKAAGRDRRVYFVNIHVPRSWEKSNNKVIRACDAAFSPDRVHVIDWNYVASTHPSWTYRDRTHLTPTGAKAYARVIDRVIDATSGTSS